MAATLRGGPRTMQLSVDEENYREYVVKFLVQGDRSSEGPLSALRAVAAVYPIGSSWNFSNDATDQWATRRSQTQVSIHEEKEGDGAEWYAVECIYSNKPPKSGRCEGEETTNPLCIADKVSGRFVKYNEEATTCDSLEFYEDGTIGDAFTGGDIQIRNSAYEPISGPTVEFPKNRQKVIVEQNVINLELDLLAQMIDTVNDATLWGFPNRTIMLTDVSWTKRYYGNADNTGSTGTGTGTDNCPDYTGCQVYYTRTLEFDIDYNGFERTLLDKASMVLNGHWENVNSNVWVLDQIDGVDPDPTKPTHFTVFPDRKDNLTHGILNGNGLPAKATVNGTTTGIGTIKIYKFPATNFLLLSLPTTL